MKRYSATISMNFGTAVVHENTLGAEPEITIIDPSKVNLKMPSGGFPISAVNGWGSAINDGNDGPVAVGFYEHGNGEEVSFWASALTNGVMRVFIEVYQYP